MKETYEITCPNCGASDFQYTDSGNCKCNYCQTNYMVSEIIGKTGTTYEGLARSYFIKRNKIIELEKSLSALGLDHETSVLIKRLERKQYLEINQEKEKRKGPRIFFSILYVLATLAVTFLIAFALDLSVGITILILIVLMIFRFGIWKKIEEKLIAKQAESIKQRIKQEKQNIIDQNNRRKKEINDQLAALRKEVKSLERKINGYE